MGDLDFGKAERPSLVLLGDQAMLVRFASRLDDPANQRALGFVATLRDDPIIGVVETVPSLVSVLLRYDPEVIGPGHLAGEIRLRLSQDAPELRARQHVIGARFGGDDGPDLDEVCERLNLSREAFIVRHNAQPLRVLTTGFAPGFVYCGFHDETMYLPRRTEVRPQVPMGSLLFAAGQSAITATEVPTGWHVIGHTTLRNFDPTQDPPTQLKPGDFISFGPAT